MTVHGVTFIAVCPACGVDCTWTNVYTEPATPESLKVSCPCEGVEDAEPVELEEMVPNTPATAPMTLQAVCAHGRMYGCGICREDDDEPPTPRCTHGRMAGTHACSDFADAA